jgi:NTE family protein
MKIGLALGSGGARGFAHVAYLEAIDELGIKIDSIAGSSIGSFLGAYYAAGMSAREIQNVIKTFTLKNFNKLFDLTQIRESGIFKGKKMENFLRDTLPVQRFEDLKIPLKIVATDYWNEEEFVFSKGDLVPAIRASISIPGVFKPYEHNNNLFIDGGIINPLPFNLLVKESDFIIAIDVSGEKELHEKTMPMSVEILLSTFQMMHHIIIKQHEPAKHVDIYCKPSLNGYKSLEFYKSKEIIESAQGDAKRFKKELLQSKIFSKS